MKQHEFIVLYDAAPEFSLKGMDLDEMYEVLGLDGRHGQTRKKIHDTLCERIEGLLKVDSNEAPHVTYSELLKSKEYWFYKDRINNTSLYQPYILVIKQIYDSFGKKLQYLIPYSESEKWIEAMRYLKCLIEWNHDSVITIENTMERQIDRSAAIKRLMKYGMRVYFDDEHNEMVVDKDFIIQQRIGSTIEKVGGARCVEIFLKYYADYSEEYRRFVQRRQGYNLAVVHHKLDDPVAYLINLSFNKLSYKGNPKYIGDLRETVKLATDLCVAKYDAQTYMVFEDIFYNKENIDDYFRQLVIWDSLYTIPQSSPIFVRDLISFMLSEFQKLGFEMSEIYTLQDYASVMDYMMGEAQIGEFKQLRFSDVLRKLGMEEYKLSAIWKDVGAKTVNAGYISPLNYSNVSVLFNPAYSLPNGDLLLYPAPLGAMGWYEVMADKLRENNNQADNIIGDMMEDYLHYKFAQKGIPSKTGDYDVDGVHGECDVAIEGKEETLLMELKKKNLTRLSKEGHPYQIILDLAAALFNSQEQALRTETFLTEKGTLDLIKNGNVATLTKEDRRIEKISVSLNEYGDIHMRYVVEKVLEIFLCYEISFKEEEIAAFLGDAAKAKKVMKDLKALKTKQEAMRDYVDRLLKFPQTGDHHKIFFNSGFHSMEQLCYLLSISKGTEDFIKQVTKLKFVTYCTKDFWVEEKKGRIMNRVN